MVITIPYSFQVSLASVNRGDGYELIFLYDFVDLADQ